MSSTDVSKLSRKFKVSALAGATPQMAIRSSTAGTTPQGMPPATSGQPERRNYNGTGPEPQKASNAQLSFRKRTKL